ncbi:MAG TPA: zinc-binding alcohol dehydrogenase family protein [Polyangiaceae bacterium]|nr:zinc-binding alcohol dehydrogenase family protein [Polyangiaceae bacterium]
MKAVAFRRNLPVEHPEALEDLTLPEPVPGTRDLLVRVAAISVNPVDYKIRQNRKPAEGKVEVLGWDAVGIVEGVGSDVSRFKVGDRVYYAGAINRPGANSELHVVDERIASRAPTTLNDSDAAALPLTTITAYELLFDRLRVEKGGGAGKTILVVGGAGGVGSILIQLARQLTGLRIIATASRPETRKWCLDLGAHAVIDHNLPLAGALKAAGVDQVDYVASLTQTAQHFEQLVEVLKPQGALGVIDEAVGIDSTKLMSKSISLHRELMFTRSLYQTPDMDQQGQLLQWVAELVDQGRIRTTAHTHLGTINAANLRKAHALLESGRAQGKTVLAGFSGKD